MYTSRLLSININTYICVKRSYIHVHICAQRMFVCGCMNVGHVCIYMYTHNEYVGMGARVILQALLELDTMGEAGQGIVETAVCLGTPFSAAADAWERASRVVAFRCVLSLCVLLVCVCVLHFCVLCDFVCVLCICVLRVYVFCVCILCCVFLSVFVHMFLVCVFVFFCACVFVCFVFVFVCF